MTASPPPSPPGPTIRAAIYARYSSDRQNERSIADQVAVLTDVAQRRGWTVVASYMDAAISGAAMANRPGLLNALAAAERGEFDKLLVEDEDRIARDEEHQWHVYNRLGAAGVGVATLGTEQVSRMQMAFKSFMSADFLQVLAQKTRRGMASNADKGLATGSRLYGYRSRPGGDMEIVEDQAEVIRRIFTLFVQGLTGRDIAETLNREHVPSPHGRLWHASTIRGSAQRANGILRSEIYAGIKVYNRVEIRKDRTTGRKITLCKPPSEHRRVEVPHLAILDRDLWDRAQSRLKQRHCDDPAKLVQLRRRPGLLTGLVKCGNCGAAYTSLSQGRLVCAAYREKGSVVCNNNRHVGRREVEDRVLTGLRERLLNPDLVAEYVRAYHASWAERAADVERRRKPLIRRQGEIERAIERGAEALLSGAAPAAVIGPKLQALEIEKADVARQLQDLDREAPPPVQLHPRAAENYAARITAFQQRLADAAGDSANPAEREIVDAVRDLIERIDIHPTSHERGAPFEVILHGQLARFVRPSKGANEAGTQCGSKVVVGGGIALTPTLRIAC